MSPPKPHAEYRTVPIHLIDPPRLVSRETFDEQKLTDLADTIRVVGLIQPIVVVPRDGRFEVVAGHRRLIAARIARCLDLPCRVLPASTVSPEALKVIENNCREDVNAGEEAVYFQRLLTELCEGDTDRLARLVQQSRDYVEGRLVLLHGDADVLAAVKRSAISYSVARELNMVRDLSARRLYLDSAVKSGAPARLAREWRLRANAMSDLQGASPAPEDADGDRPIQPSGSALNCVLCDDSEDVHEMELVYMHRSCQKVLFRPFLRGLKGGS